MAIDFFRPDHRCEEDVLDLDLVAWDATDDGWVTVAAAASAAGVGTGTVRHWYRSGRLPTHRSSGDKGAFLVRLDAVLALADEVEVEAATESLRRELDDFGVEPTWLDLPAEDVTPPSPAAYRRPLRVPAQWGGPSFDSAPADRPAPAAPAAWGGAGAAESGGGDPAPAPASGPAPAAWAHLVEDLGRADRFRMTQGHGFGPGPSFVLGGQPDDLLPRVEKRHLLR